MSLMIQNISLPFTVSESDLIETVANILQIPMETIDNFRIHKVSFDARNKLNIKKIFQVVIDVEDEESFLSLKLRGIQISTYVPAAAPTINRISNQHRATVVGMGPSGLFSALLLAKSGVDVTVIERGEKVEDRVKTINSFWQSNILNSESNVQFGEGGAGTFSDGKLTTRKNHLWSTFVLKTLIEHGAPEEILTQPKPHIGTDNLRSILIRIRKTLIDLGVKIRFSTRMTDLIISENTIKGIVTSDGDEILSDSLLLAIGHSARDTYRLLHKKGIELTAKSFAIGMRIEHPRELINSIQYGIPDHPSLPTAEYALAWNDPDTGRGIYSFCMCPGGEVINASSSPEMLVVNGMSHSDRAGDYSNSALVVSVRPEDFGNNPLDGIGFQESLEKEAYIAGGANGFAPSQNLLEFIGKKTTSQLPPLSSTVRPGYNHYNLPELFPDWVSESIRKALPQFERKMRGFVTEEATLVGVETRTSAPLRIERNRSGESLSHKGLFPIGEGAGYAGGIMSAALDGLQIADLLVSSINNSSKVVPT